MKQSSLYIRICLICVLLIILVVVALAEDVLREVVSTWHWEGFSQITNFIRGPIPSNKTHKNISSPQNLQADIRRPIPFNKTQKNLSIPQRSKAAAAICLTGGVRTFMSPKVSQSFSQFITTMESDFSGLASGDRPDLFAYISTVDAPPKNQAGMLFTTQPVRKDELEILLRQLNFTEFKLLEDAAEVTIANVDSYALDREACLQFGFWHDVAMLARSVSQLTKAQHCLDLVLAHEKRMGSMYDFVMLTRPDFFYRASQNYKVNMSSVLHKDYVFYQKDWYFAMPRSVVSNMLDPLRARPLTCSRGSKCCGQPWNSEIMWEYVLGVEIVVGKYRPKVQPPRSKYKSRWVCLGDIARDTGQRMCWCKSPRNFCTGDMKWL